MADSHLVPEITDDFVQMMDDYLVPRVYAQWAHHVSDIAAIESGNRVLDVACGTGILARVAQMEVGMGGKVTGLDHNEKMLAIAKKKSPGIDWQSGDAAALPFDDNSFDRVLCQFALTFMGNRISAIREMLRVCRPKGRIAVAVWAPIEFSRGYHELFKLTRQFAGERAAMKLATPWSLGVPGKMDALLLSAGVNEYECHERHGITRFPSVATFVEVHLRTAGEFDRLDKVDFNRMLSAAKHTLAPFSVANGEIAADLNANIYLISAS